MANPRDRRLKRGGGGGGNKYCTNSDLIVANYGIGTLSPAIGNDGVGKHIAMTTNPFMHEDNWVFDVNTLEVANELSKRLYSETSTTETNTIWAIGTGISDYSKLRFRVRQTGYPEYDIQSTLSVFSTTSTVNQCRLVRSGNTITLYSGENSEVLVSDISTGIQKVADRVTIGAMIRGTDPAESDFTGKFYNFNLNGLKVPINEGAGVDILDSSGTKVGDLVDPGVNFWGYFITPLGTLLTTQTYVIPPANIGGTEMYIDPLASFGSGRPIANFDNDYVTTTTSCLNGAGAFYFKVQIYGDSSATTNSAIYTEYKDTIALSNRTCLFYKTGTKLTFRFYGDDLVTISAQEEVNKVVFDDSIHEIEIIKLAGQQSATIRIDDVTLPITFTETLPTSTMAEIGRQNSTGLETLAKMWDLYQCDTLIPLDEESGTEIFDSEGTKVGDLTEVAPNTYFDNWLRCSDNAIVDTPTINPNPGGGRTVGTLSGNDQAAMFTSSLQITNDYKRVCGGYIHPSTTSGSNYLFAWIESPASILVNRSGSTITMSINDGATSESVTLFSGIQAGTAQYFEVYAKNGSAYVVIDGAQQAEKVLTTSINFTYTTARLGATFAASPQLSVWGFYFGDELFEANEGAGSTMTGDLGNIMTITDGAPIEFWDKVLYLDEIEDATTYPPNELSDIGVYGQEYTREEYVALHNAQNRFVAEDGMRAAFYDTDQVIPCLTKALRWTGYGALIPAIGYWSLDFSEPLNSFYIGLL